METGRLGWGDVSAEVSANGRPPWPRLDRLRVAFSLAERKILRFERGWIQASKEAPVAFASFR